MAKTLGTKFRASNADRYLNCWASVVAAQHEPSGGSTFHADKGTVAHKVGELCIMNGDKVKDFVGTKPCEGEGIDIEFDEDMVEAVEMYVDYVLGLGLSHLEVERKVSMPWIPNANGEKTTGYIDCVGYDPDFNTLYIIDYKNGIMPVGGDSLQFPTYGVPMLSQFKGLKSVVTVCVQPNSMDGDYIKEHTWSVSELKDHKAEIINTVELVNSYEPEDLTKDDYHDGSWCKFCPNKHQCPVLGDQLFDALPCAKDGESMKSVKPINKLDEVVIQDIVRNKKKIVEFLDEVCKNAYAKAQDGNAVPGTKLVEGRKSNRSWSGSFSEEMVVSTALKAGVKEDDIFKTTRKLITPNQLEKKMGKHKNLIQPMIMSGVPAIVLVDESDPRSEVSSSNDGDFDDEYSTSNNPSNNDF